MERNKADEFGNARDNSLEAMRRRYDKANLLTIASHNSIIFTSLQDVLVLIDKVKDLENKLKDCQCQVKHSQPE